MFNPYISDTALSLAIKILRTDMHIHMTRMISRVDYAYTHGRIVASEWIYLIEKIHKVYLAQG